MWQEDLVADEEHNMEKETGKDKYLIKIQLIMILHDIFKGSN